MRTRRIVVHAQTPKREPGETFKNYLRRIHKQDGQKKEDKNGKK